MQAHSLVRWSLAALCVSALGAVVNGQRPQLTEPPSLRNWPAGPARAWMDAHGDPLPAGALLRIGTIRYRDGGVTDQAVLTPDGKTCVCFSDAGIQFFDLATGRRTHWFKDCGVPSQYAPNNSLFVFAPMGRGSIL